MKKRLAALTLALAMILVSCAAQKTEDPTQADAPKEGGTASTDAAGEELSAEEEETELKDGVPDSLKYDGATIRIFVSNGSGQNEEMYAGKGELTGDVENDAIIQRNTAAEDRLDINLEYIGDPTGAWDTIAGILTKFIMAGDTTYDMYLGNEYGHVNLITLGGLTNVNTLEYIDLEKPWWNVKYMDEMMIGNDARYFLAGDYIIETIRMAHTLFFNKNFYQDTFGNPDERELPDQNLILLRGDST